MTSFWSIYISVLSLGTIAVLTWLIFAVRLARQFHFDQAGRNLTPRLRVGSPECSHSNGNDGAT